MPETETVPEPQGDLEKVQKWAHENKISAEVVKVLTKEGWTSMEALELLEAVDLEATKIPRGQQKLLLKAVQVLKPKTNPPNPEPAIEGAAEGAGAATRAASGDQSDPYVAAAATWLQQQQQQGQRQQLAPPEQQQPATSAQPVSWQDPQIHLRNAGRSSEVKYLDITEFIMDSGAAERVLSENDGTQVIVRSGPSKPKLETVTKDQWSLANLAILNKLVSEGLLDKQGMLDYLSHSALVYKYFVRFDKNSVLSYDREYRRDQAKYQFRWGTHASHLESVHLIPRADTMRQRGPASGSGDRGKGPRTRSGDTICKRYNSTQGCLLAQCKFKHVCSFRGCEAQHPLHLH